MERAYPEQLKRAGIGGKVAVWVFIDTEGNVNNASISETSGNEELDAAALAAAREFDFKPAQNGEQVVPVWVKIPITFAVADAVPGEAKPKPPAPRRAPDADALLKDEPAFVSYTDPPKLRDKAAAVRTVETYYRSDLKRAGIAGTATVWIFVDSDGVVKDTKVKDSSGSDELDAAALAAARDFEFTPAENNGEPVAVWVAVPITFSVK